MSRRTNLDIAVPPDEALGEIAYPDEAALAQEMADAITAFVRERDGAGPYRRDVHPKAHGAVHATLTVADDLPPAWRTDVFRPRANYAAWVRFSNSSPKPRSDQRLDARGMAVKVLGPKGPRLRSDPEFPTACDFIAINYPRFFIADPRDYLTFIRRGLSTHWWERLAAPLALGVKGAAIATAAAGQPLLPLHRTQFWSTVPYAWGIGPARRAVKYTFRPVSPLDELPLGGGEHALRDALQEVLAYEPIVFELAVQARSGEAQPVEDPTVLWDEADAPFVPVARLTLEPQEFSTAERDALAERLAFNPWHCSAEHRPLGAINRLRLAVYAQMAALRASGR
ncbi:MAG TPA: catalase [Tahibacter sp.]|uniref:catalase n=1 Tax=Tahibacter sp. TaxID=2056211 RepID=UPI002C2541FB|nr:catalase [Tahibacter sp.]HSX62276.1 catalase [Tahibacter sp.]